MSTPNRKEIIDAHSAANKLAELAVSPVGATTQAFLATEYRDQILAALPPKPQPTMAEVKWDDDLHYLAEAEHSLYGYVMMLEPMEDDPGVKFLCNDDGLFRLTWASPERLTPTGRRYTLTEVQDA